MAEKRMISKRVFLSNGFHRMSNGAKALYVMLALHSDDDGFSNSAAICEAFLGVGDEALSELIRGGFVMWFEDEGVALITHWKQQNCLKNERVGKLSYPGIARRIFVHQNGTYSLERGEDGVSFGSYKECLYRYGRDAAEGMLKCATGGSILEGSAGMTVGNSQVIAGAAIAGTPAAKAAIAGTTIAGTTAAKAAAGVANGGNAQAVGGCGNIGACGAVESPQTVGSIGTVGNFQGNGAMGTCGADRNFGAVSAPFGLSGGEVTVGIQGGCGKIGAMGTVADFSSNGDVETVGNFEIKTDVAGVFSQPIREDLCISRGNNRGEVSGDEIINYVSSEGGSAFSGYFGGEAGLISAETGLDTKFSSVVGEASGSDVTIHNFLGNPGEKNGKEERRTESFYAAEAAVARAREAATASPATADGERDTVLSFFRKNGGYPVGEAPMEEISCPPWGEGGPYSGFGTGAPFGIGASPDGERAGYGGGLSPFSEKLGVLDSDPPVFFGDDGGGLPERWKTSGDGGGETGELCEKRKRLCEIKGELCEKDEKLCEIKGKLCEKDEMLCETEGELCETKGELCENEEMLCETDEKLCENEEILCENVGALRSGEKGALRGEIRRHLDGFEVLEDDNSGDYEVCRDGRFLRRYDGRIFQRMPAVDGSSGDLLLPIDRLVDLPGAKNDSERLEAFLAKEEGYSDADFRVSAIGGLGRGVVMLSEVQIGRLLRELSLEEFDHYVSRLAEFIEKNHPTVKNHYKTILRWVREDRAIDA